MYAYVTYICDIYIYIYLFCAATFQTHRCKQSHITYSQLHTSFSYILTHILHSLLPIFRFSDRTDIMTFFSIMSGMNKIFPIVFPITVWFRSLNITSMLSLFLEWGELIS